MNINHAILHIFDAQSAVTVFSEAELEFDTRAVKSFVTKHLKRSRNAADNHPGSFTECLAKRMDEAKAANGTAGQTSEH